MKSRGRRPLDFIRIILSFSSSPDFSTKNVRICDKYVSIWCHDGDHSKWSNYFIYFSIHPSIRPSISQPLYLAVSLAICLPTCLPIYQSINQLINISTVSTCCGQLMSKHVLQTCEFLANLTSKPASCYSHIHPYTDFGLLFHKCSGHASRWRFSLPNVLLEAAACQFCRHLSVWPPTRCFSLFYRAYFFTSGCTTQHFAENQHLPSWRHFLSVSYLTCVFDFDYSSLPSDPYLFSSLSFGNSEVFVPNFLWQWDDCWFPKTPGAEAERKDEPAGYGFRAIHNPWCRPT